MAENYIPTALSITPRSRRQSAASIDPSMSLNPAPFYTSNSNYEIHETSETVLAERQQALLKRRSSWRKFKDTLTNWVGVKNCSEEEPVEESELTMRNSDFVVEDAEALLKSTNCYSSSKIERNSNVPRIVVTGESFPETRKLSEGTTPSEKKMLAVANIKKAIYDMQNSTDTISPTQIDQNRRRHSDVVIREKSEDPNMIALTRSQSAKLHKTKPMIWEHFDSVPNNAALGKCKTCHMNVSCKYNTGQFVRHLQNSHKDLYRSYQKKIDALWTQSVIAKNLK